MLTERELADRARKIARLERERQETTARECELIAEMGRILGDTKSKLRGRWEKWTKTNLPFSRKTADRYVDVASHWTTLSSFASQGKSVLYQLLELDEKTLARLTPSSKIAGKKIRDMEDCHELDEAIAEMKGEKRDGPSELAKTMGAIQVLQRVKTGDPELWSEIDDDVAALLGGALPAKPQRTMALEGATRPERGRRLLELLRQVLALIDDVDDVGGILPPEIKQEAMVVAQAIWREVNRLPAYATLPAKDPAPDAPRRKGKIAP